MKIERISTRLVKPHNTIIDAPPLRVALSNFDLQFAPLHVQRLFAYNAPVPPTMALEEGLSKVLSEYREWAGRLITEDASGRPAIVLNDEGAVLIEAKAHGNLHDLWPFNPSHLLLDLIPIDRSTDVPELLLIQVTRFACGGVSLGVASHHQVVDGVGVCEFLEAWASMVQGLPIACTPLHDRSALMARDPPQLPFDQSKYQEPVVKLVPTRNHPALAIKRLHFSAQLLQEIKAKVTKGAEQGLVYSSFVSLLAHIWKCITKARGLEDEEGETRAFVPVNVRKRLDSPLPKGYFGSVVCHTCASAKMKDVANKPLSFAANYVHKAIKKVNNDYARFAIDIMEIRHKNCVHIDQTDNLVDIHQRRKAIMTPNLLVSSWITLPLYNLDFGWGTPMFARPACIDLEGLGVFVPSHKKDGSIDVVLGLFAPDMEKMEAICFT